MPIVRLVSLAVVSAFVLAACALPAAPPPEETVADPVTVAERVDGEFLPVSAPPGRIVNSEWSTDFSRRTVEWEEIRPGGPAKDGIPAIDDPAFESVAVAREWLSDRDPVLRFEHQGDARAYPLAILIWHEIVNDQMGDMEVAVTFCPLCNAGIVFDRTFDGQVLDFGTTGLLRNSDLIMYDRQTETWWQQLTGTGIVGEWAGRQLTFLAAQVISFGEFAAEHPDGQVLARPPIPRPYGTNPYSGYDSGQMGLFAFGGEPDERLGPFERVVGLTIGDTAVAYPFGLVAAAGAVNDRVGATPLVVLHQPGMSSALDTQTIAEGREVGSAAVFDRRIGSRVLTFAAGDGDGVFRDTETGSTWNIFGEATGGELAGTELTQVTAFDHFWFAWAAFYPETDLYGAE